MKRRYRQTRRAAASAETRQRIVDATIELHSTVGPAQTTVSAIAAGAGVERLTVYRHFPREEELLRASVSHGWERFPPPNPETWATILDPEERLRTALGELYGYYGSVGDAFLVVVRDFRRVPTLAQLNAPYFAKWDEMRDVLAKGWGRRGRRRRALLVAIGHSLDLSTWESLVRREGMPETEAVELLVRLVRCA